MPPPLVPDQVEGDLMHFGQDFGEYDQFRVVSDVLEFSAAARTVLQVPEVEEEELDEQLNFGSGPVHQHEQHIISPDEQPGPEIPEDSPSPAAPIADMDIPDGDLADDELPVAEDLPEERPAAIASAKKRGRPSATPGKTPSSSKSKTPRTAINGTSSKTTTGRKRKAEDIESEAEPTPVKRPRGRPPRGAAATASARLAAKSAKKGKPGRPKSATAPKATTNPKRGGPKGATKAEPQSTDSESLPKGEYEVEKILESVIDGDTFEHMYRVKWKGYGEDEATWEPKTNLEHAHALITAFDAQASRQTRKPRGSATSNGDAAPKVAKTAKATSATKAKSEEVKKPGRPVGRPRKAGRPAAAATKSKKPAGRPAGRPPGRPPGRPAGRPGRPKKVIS